MRYLPKKRWVRITFFLVILFACLQFFRPKPDNPVVISRLDAPATVKTILHGSTFVKVIWEQVLDSPGILRTGEFIQTDLMIKDKSKYASTNGWGYARWLKGMQLTPYGKDAHFATECVNCHRERAAARHRSASA